MMHQRQFLLDGNYKLLLCELGVNLPDFLRRARLPYDLFDGLQPAVSAEEYYRLWAALTAYDGEMLLPLQAGLAVSPELFNPVLIVSLASRNGQAALERMIKYKRLMAPMRFTLNMHQFHGDLVIASDQEGNALPLGLTAFEMVFVTRILCMGTRAEIRPLSVHCTEEIQNSAYANFFGTQPTVGDVNVVRFRREDLEREFLTCNQAVWNFYLKGLDERLQRTKPEPNFTAVVKASLARLLPTGEVTIEMLSGDLGLSRRTIQRRLMTENTTFQDLLTAVRADFAKKYVLDTEVSTKEIAFLLGYNEPNSFLRAFKLWTGKTVREYREGIWAG